VESGRLGSDFRPLPAGGVALSVPDQCRVRDRSTIMARHLYADMGDAFADAQARACPLQRAFSRIHYVGKTAELCCAVRGLRCAGCWLHSVISAHATVLRLTEVLMNKHGPPLVPYSTSSSCRERRMTCPAQTCNVLCCWAQVGKLLQSLNIDAASLPAVLPGRGSWDDIFRCANHA